MSEQNTRKVAEALEYAAEKLPGLRVGQIIFNAVGADPFYIEDDNLAQAIREYADESAARPGTA